MNMSTQSSSKDSILSLELTVQYLYQFGGPILISIGIVSCILSLIVFTRKNLRKNPCSIYLTAFHISSLAFICTSLLFTTLSTAYNFNVSIYNLSFCRFVIYLSFIWSVLPPSYLILASIDRILITSPNAGTRRRSTRRLAYISIVGVTLFWMLFHIHALFLVNIIQFAPNYYACYFNPGVYLTFTAYYSLIVTAILVPLLMIVLGLCTLKNLRSTGRARVAPVLSLNATTGTNNLHSVRSKDRQFVRILVVDTSIYIIFISMLSIFLMYQQITQYNTKTILQSQIEHFVLFLITLTTFTPFCVSCYTNLLASKAFRNELKNALLCK